MQTPNTEVKVAPLGRWTLRDKVQCSAPYPRRSRASTFTFSQLPMCVVNRRLAEREPTKKRAERLQTDYSSENFLKIERLGRY